MVCRLISFNTHNSAMEQGLLLLLFAVPTLRQKDWGSEISTNSSEISRLVSGRLETCHLPTSPLSVPSSLQSIFWSGWASCSFLKAPGRSRPLCLCWAVVPIQRVLASHPLVWLAVSHPSFKASSTVLQPGNPPKPNSSDYIKHRDILGLLWTCHSHAYF